MDLIGHLIGPLHVTPHNHADCVGNDCNAVLSGDIVTSCWLSSG